MNIKFLSNKIFIIATLLFTTLVATDACRAGQFTINDRHEYAAKIYHDGIYDFELKNPSIAIANPFNQADQSAITSFSDAFLWTTKIKTRLEIGYDGTIVFVYLQDFDHKEHIDFKNKFLNEIYERYFERIQSGGPCTKIVATTISTDKKVGFVFLSKNSDYDTRISCIYRHYRAQFGINEKLQMATFQETFLMDLRILGCKYRNTESADFMQLISVGKC